MVQMISNSKAAQSYSCSGVNTFDVGRRHPAGLGIRTIYNSTRRNLDNRSLSPIIQLDRQPVIL